MFGGQDLNVQVLREKGFSDDEIVGALKLKYSESFDFAKAKERGISSNELVEYFASAPKKVAQNRAQEDAQAVQEVAQEAPVAQASEGDSLQTGATLPEPAQGLMEANSALPERGAQASQNTPKEINPAKTPALEQSEPTTDLAPSPDVESVLKQQGSEIDNYKKAGDEILSSIIGEEREKGVMLDEMPIMPKAPNEQEKNLSKLKREISALEALHNGTFALNPLFDSQESKKQKQQELLNYFASSVSKMGYKPKVMQERGGGLKFGVEIDGAVHDVTPSFLDALARNGLEIGLSLASIAAIPFTGGASLAGLGAAAAGAGARAAAGSAARAALSSAAGKGFAYGVAGSAAGAGGDYLLNSKIAGETPSALGTTKAILGGAGNEALGVGIGEAIMKAVQSVPRFSGKVIDYSPVIGALRKQNINGALRELEKQVGGKEEAEKLLALAQKRGTTLESTSKSEAFEVAKNLLDSKSKELRNPKLRAGASRAKEAVELLDRYLLSDEIQKGQSKILTLARANPRLAEMLGSVVKSEPKAAENLKRIINTDTEKIFHELESLKGDALGIRGAAKEYVINTKRAFSDMLEELGGVYEGRSAKLRDNKRVGELLEDLATIKEEAWGANFPPRLKGLWQQLELERELSIKDINKLRIELNRVIENSSFFEAREAARRTKSYLESEVLEDILEQLPLKHEAKELYKRSVAEYKAMKGIEESRWYKNRVENPDVGDEAVINKALKVFLETSENASIKGSSVNELLARISPKNQAGIELEFIERVLKNSELVGESVRALDLKEALNTLKGVQFQSAEARGFNELLGELERLIGNDSTIAKSIGGFKEQKKLSQGISQDPMARLATQKANFIIKNAFRLFPIIGDQPALLHHLSIAAQSAKSYTGFRAHLEHIAKSPDLERGIRANLRAFLRSAEEFEEQAKRAEIEYKRGDDGNGSDGFSGGGNPNGGSNPRGGGDSGNDGNNGGGGVQATSSEAKEAKSGGESIANTDTKIQNATKEAWLKTFGLKSVDETYTPTLPAGLKERLGDREVKLTKGSLLKVIERKRERYIPIIKETLENPSVVFKEGDFLIFAKEHNKKAYFTSIGRDYDTHITVVSNAPKKINSIKRKLENVEVIYQSPNFGVLRYNKLLQDERSIANRTEGIPEGSIAQKEPSKVETAAQEDFRARPEGIENIDEFLSSKRHSRLEDGEKIRARAEKLCNEYIDQRFYSGYFTNSAQNFWASISKLEGKAHELEEILKRLASTPIHKLPFKSEAGQRTAFEAMERFFKDTLKRVQRTIEFKKASQADKNALEAFGDNFPEFYHDGKGAVEKLLKERRGQVAGAFYRDDLGDIDLVWGKTGSGKSDGYGLSKIEKFHPEVLEKLKELTESLPLIKESENRAQLSDSNYLIAIRKEFDGDKRNWVLTAFEKREGTTKRRTDLPSEEAKKPTLASTPPSEIIAQNEAHLKPSAVKETQESAIKSAEELKQKEQRGIYNVTFNDKQATYIHKDLESVEEALLYSKGSRTAGAKHIRITHLSDSTQKGYVTKEELLNIGEDMRAFLKTHGEPFIDRNGARIYEWDKEEVRFRVVIGEASGTDPNPASAREKIITFYSDRNINKPMEFKNPKLKESAQEVKKASAKQPLELDEFLSLQKTVIPKSTKELDKGAEKILSNYLKERFTEGYFELARWEKLPMSEMQRREKELDKLFKTLEKIAPERLPFEEGGSYVKVMMLRRLQRMQADIDEHIRTRKWKETNAKREEQRQRKIDDAFRVELEKEGEIVRSDFSLSISPALLEELKQSGKSVHLDTTRNLPYLKGGVVIPNSLIRKQEQDFGSFARDVKNIITKAEAQIAKQSDGVQKIHSFREGKEVVSRIEGDSLVVEEVRHRALDKEAKKLLEKETQPLYRFLDEYKQSTKSGNLRDFLDYHAKYDDGMGLGHATDDYAALFKVDNGHILASGHDMEGYAQREIIARYLFQKELKELLENLEHESAGVQRFLQGGEERFLELINKGQKLLLEKHGDLLKRAKKPKAKTTPQNLSVAKEESAKEPPFISSNSYGELDREKAQETILQANALVLAPLLGFIPAGDDEFILENQSSVLVLLGLGLGSLAGRKISGERLKKLANALPKGALESLARVLKQKEQRGIYNVTFNEKKSSRIYKDLEVVEDFLKYEKGRENPDTDKGFGAMHIQKHLDTSRGGWVSKEELLNLGEIMRNAQEKEIKGSKSVYTYFNDEGVRFRVVIGKRESKTGQAERVITFYSDRRAER
ncbi:MAG: PBECR2 nuclease fold domain-containing protein [Wolinella sp.]